MRVNRETVEAEARQRWESKNILVHKFTILTHLTFYKRRMLSSAGSGERIVPVVPVRVNVVFNVIKQK